MRLRPHLPRRDVAPAAHHDRLALFSVLWALAAVWHLLGNTFAASGWTQALLAVAAGIVLWRPGEAGPLALLAVAGVLTVWDEAPLLGNHWLLAGFVNAGILMAVAVGVARRRGRDTVDLASRLFPVARLTLLTFYAFASFAKINSGFFDRSTSCAVFYFEESTSSLGLTSLQLGGAAWLQWAVIVGTVIVELSIPVLLVVRRTRNVGVVVALAFHALLALDHSHQFFDFSSVLTALFVLFLPISVGTWVVERVGSVRARLALVDERFPQRVHAGLAVLPVLAGLAVAGEAVDAELALEVGWWPWQVFVVTVMVATVRFLGQNPPAPLTRAMRPHHAAFLLVPLLVVGNGLTPYLELKTAYGWNMYANLRTVDGASNHYLVRRTLPLTDEQADLVRIVSTDDPGLSIYADRGYALTWRQLRTYAADHPAIQLTYRRAGATVALQQASDRPELVEPVPTWREKLQLFRAVDLQDPERCVPAFGPAR